MLPDEPRVPVERAGPRRIVVGQRDPPRVGVAGGRVVGESSGAFGQGRKGNVLLDGGWERLGRTRVPQSLCVCLTVSE